MFLDRGKNPEYLEEIHADTERASKTPHLTEMGTLDLWCGNAAHSAKYYMNIT